MFPFSICIRTGYARCISYHDSELQYRTLRTTEAAELHDFANINALQPIYICPNAQYLSATAAIEREQSVKEKFCILPSSSLCSLGQCKQRFCVLRTSCMLQGILVTEYSLNFFGSTVLRELCIVVQITNNIPLWQCSGRYRLVGDRAGD